MSNKLKYFLIVTVILSSSLLIVQCTKENFTEPIDPFEIQRLDPNPTTLTLGTGDNALTLKANDASVSTTPNGKRIKGSLYIANGKYGDIRLSNGDFELTEDTSLSKANNGLYFTGFKGVAIINLPQDGLLKNLTIPGLTAAPIGFQKGSEFDLDNYSWPVNPDRYYFYYENLNPFPVNITNSSLENIKKIAIDPTDPFFFVSCDLNGTPLGDISDAGLAISAQGLIPFNPKVSISEFKMDSFYGNLYITGNIPLGDYPVTFTGESVLSFDSDNNEDSDLFFAGKSSDFILGLNGTLFFDSDALDWMGIDVELGSATTEFFMSKTGDTQLRFVGIREEPGFEVSDFIKQIIGKDYNFLDYLAPYQTRETFYGSIGTELSDWEMGFKLDTWLELPGGFNIDMGHCYLFVNTQKMSFDGMARLAGFTAVGVKGDVNFDNGNFKLKGYIKNSFHASAGKLSIGYSLAMDVTLENNNGVVSFGARVKLKGKACLGTLCAHITIRASVNISSNGSFKVCFSVGIGKIGFDVCIHKNALKDGQYRETMEYEQIPLKLVPMENRFEAYECN